MTRLELILSCLTICLLAGLVMSVSLNTYYLARISDLEETLLAYESELALYTVSIDFLFDYGNGTRAWVNETRFPAGTPLLNATMAIADVETRPGYPGHPGIAVKGINGVLEKSLAPMQSRQEVVRAMTCQTFRWIEEEVPLLLSAPRDLPDSL